MAVSDESRERVLWILRSTIGAFPRPEPVHLGVLGGLPGEVLAYRTVLPQALMLLAPWWQFMSRHASSYSSTVMGKPESGLVPYWSEHTLPAVDRWRADELVSGLYGFFVGGWRYSSDDLPAFREPDYLRVDPRLVLPVPLDHIDYPGVQGMTVLDELRYKLNEARFDFKVDVDRGSDSEVDLGGQLAPFFRALGKIDFDDCTEVVDEDGRTCLVDSSGRPVLFYG